jgi:hypothetical protein
MILLQQKLVVMLCFVIVIDYTYHHNVHTHTNTHQTHMQFYMHRTCITISSNTREKLCDIVSTKVAIQDIVAFSLQVCLAQWTTECTVLYYATERIPMEHPLPHLPWSPTISLQHTSLRSGCSVHMNVGPCAVGLLEDGRGGWGK